MKYKVNLGSVIEPKYSLFDNLVDAKKAIREKLKSLHKNVMLESSVCTLERGVYGLGYRFNTGVTTSTRGIVRITRIKEQGEEVKE